MSWFSDAIDRAIEIVSPQRALERKAARAAAEQFGEYKGARQTRLTGERTPIVCILLAGESPEFSLSAICAICGS